MRKWTSSECSTPGIQSHSCSSPVPLKWDHSPPRATQASQSFSLIKLMSQTVWYSFSPPCVDHATLFYIIHMLICKAACRFNDLCRGWYFLQCGLRLSSLKAVFNAAEGVKCDVLQLSSGLLFYFEPWFFCFLTVRQPAIDRCLHFQRLRHFWLSCEEPFLNANGFWDECNRKKNLQKRLKIW